MSREVTNGGIHKKFFYTVPYNIYTVSYNNQGKNKPVIPPVKPGGTDEITYLDLGFALSSALTPRPRWPR